MAFAFKCGCPLDEARLHFQEGRLVCPEHGEDLAPFDRPDAPWRGRATLELELVAPLRKAAEHAVDAILDAIDGQEAVRNAWVTIEDTAPEAVA